MAGEFKIVGTEAVLKKLGTLSAQLQRKAINAAMRKAMNIVKKAAITKAKAFDDPSTTEKVWKEIVVRSNAKGARRIGPQTFLVNVGVRGGAKKYVDNKGNRRAGRVGDKYEGAGNLYYWRFLEFGTSQMAARPFMRPALADNIPAVVNTMSTELNSAIDKIIAKGVG